jgi:hypothetical protein
MGSLHRIKGIGEYQVMAAVCARWEQRTLVARTIGQLYWTDAA